MSTREKLITARLGMLALAEELNNISKACKVASVSRSHYYEIKKAYETYGREGLAPRERRKPQMPNQTSPEIEAQILEMTERYPTYSYIRISHQLRLSGVPDSIASVRYIWQRHGPQDATTALDGKARLGERPGIDRGVEATPGPIQASG